MTGVPRIPRAQWAQHPRYPAQVVLLDSHEAFRRRSAYLIESVDYVAPDTGTDARKRARWLRRLRGELDAWVASMKSHERYEERTLYPFLARRWGADFAALEAGHRSLDAVAGEVARAFGAGDHGAVRAALLHHRDVLLVHLADEEELVIPMLLELSPDEFRAL